MTLKTMSGTSFSGKRSSVYIRGKGWKQAKHRSPPLVARPKPKLAEMEWEGPSVSNLAGFDCGSYSIPHPQKQEKGGEDAHFYCSGRANSLTMGVADGVSGWSADGVDPALYAQELSHHGEVAAKNSSIFEDDPFNILDYAHSNSLALGSSTFTIANLTSKPADKSSNGKAIAVLKWSNVGDSGVKVFRYGSVVASSPVQEHYFNCPRQLANPKKVKECDTPDVADGDEVQLQRGDVVVLATDGVFDNMYDKEIGGIVVRHSRKSANDMAEKIALKASTNSRNKKYESPFAKEAFDLERSAGDASPYENIVGSFLSNFGVGKEENPYLGGKLDDITCVVAVVKEKKN
mmetsp:Transcript_7917/g.14774  ORF Transcript_7917/g.14774 Transcript_7917/m.14774 type:complete len:347 (+) Transcript_7917:27-1067(+)